MIYFLTGRDEKAIALDICMS